jgi:hypothetical protein
MEYNELDIRNMIEEQGKSMSYVARQLGKQVGQISNFCKRHNIKSRYLSRKKQLPTEEIKEKYLNGISFYKLSKEYNRPAYIIKQQLLEEYSDIQVRTMDEAKRPPELNDHDALCKLMGEMSLTKIGLKLGVKTNTVCDAVKRLGLTAYVYRQEVDIPRKDLEELYSEHCLSTTHISSLYDTWPATVIRHLRKYGISIRPPGGVPRLSKYPKLNDKSWLFGKYISNGLSANVISQEIGCTVGMVLYFLKKYDIQIRDKKNIYRKLRRKTSNKITITTKWGTFKTSYKSEKDFIESIPISASKVEKEPITLEYAGLTYTPDFVVDGEYVEVKPIGYAKAPGPDRQKFIKQKLIADKNNIDIKTWYKGKYYDVDPISDIDKYYCLNWKLMFESPDEVFDFYSNFGFKPLEYWKDTRLKALQALDVPDYHRMSATYPNVKVTRFIKHFNPHFWYSRYKGRSAPADAFEKGYLTLLKKAINRTWEYKQAVNIYKLMKVISRYPDCASVSIFKPWIARSIYNKYLPDGGIVVDPCMGWGGRLLGTVDYDIKYIGFDFNFNSVNSNKKISKFVGSRWLHEPDIRHGDSATIEFPKADLIFTSPPYDDTEFYYGLSKQCKDTTPIYENIFKSNSKLVALNVPIRHENKVINLAKKFRWKYIATEKMKTKRRGDYGDTYEPILVFEK